MKAMIKVIFITSLLFVNACSHADTEAELMALLDDYATSVINLDLELAGKIWSKRPDTSFIQPRGHQKGWEDIKNSFYLGAMANFSKRDLRLKDINIRVLNEDTAWVDFYWDFDAVFAKDNSPITTKGRETQILSKEKDGWKIVHVHYSGPATQREREGF